jgi:predicted negative regulator of RcsB-dependent stress response
MWLDIGIVALFVVGIYAFLQMVGWRTRSMTRRSHRTAENMYEQFADSPRKQRRYAQEHGGSWSEGSGGESQPRPAPPAHRES